MSRKLLHLAPGRPLIRRVLLAQVLGPPRCKTGPLRLPPPRLRPPPPPDAPPPGEEE